MSRLVLAAALSFAAWAHPVEAQQLRFSGRHFDVKAGRALGPGPNDWGARQAFIDQDGRLHLRFSQVDGRWLAAEIVSTVRLGFGTYEIEVEGDIGRFDKNVVFGFFNYPTADVGPDATHEIDIEFARWGEPANQPLNFTVWPPVAAGLAPAHRSYGFPLRSGRSRHRFIWSRRSVSFESVELLPGGAIGRRAAWSYRPTNHARRIAAKPMPLRFNLWGFRGRPPSDGLPVEIVIRRFSFTPH